jgi:DNA-binding transcriptional MerR regulator
MFDVNEPMSGLTIKTVAERTGVSVHALRAWERRYGVPQPRREQGNRYRLYDEADIADVLWMKQHIEAGMLPAQASLLLRQHRVSRTTALAAHDQPLLETQAALESALLSSDERAVRDLLDQAFATFPIEQVALQVIQPTMVGIGDRWMRNQVTVWQEHFATNIVKQKLLAVLHSQPVPSLSVPCLVSTCAPAEEHELGLLIFSLFARRRGWRVVYLGQGTPLASVADLAHATTPAVVAVSVGTVMGLAGLIDWLVPSRRPKATLIFGGRLVNLVPSLREHLPGAFLGEDALTAVNALGAVDQPKQVRSPSPRGWSALHALQVHRLQVTGETVARFLERMPSQAPRTWGEGDLSFATLFLIDALACAYAFDAPELMDVQRTWLNTILLSRDVAPPLIRMHREIFARVLTRAIGKEDAEQFKRLLARMEERS